MSKTTTELPTTSIQTKLDQINKIYEWFTGDQFAIDAALAKYDEAIALAEAAERELKTLKNQVTVIAERFDKVVDETQEV